MTPEEISKFTDQELNEAIAVKRGWKKQPSGALEIYEPKFIRSYSAPDYCNSWQCAGELLVETPFQTKLINYEDEGNGKVYWTCDITNLFTGCELAYVTSGSPTRAIAEAWYLMESK